MAQQPLSSWTPGAQLTNYREIVFGNYIFPLSFQEVVRTSKLLIDKRRISHIIGEFSARPKNVMAGRDITVSGPVGSGLVGSAGNTLATDTDLENERVLLARLQNLGNQKLWVRSDRYCNATIEQFDHKFHDGGSFRYADWEIKFYAEDPRYYSTNANTVSMGAYSDSLAHSVNISHLGNTRAYPTITITGVCHAPLIATYQGSHVISLKFSSLNMATGDTLVVNCDPRPENRNACAIYTPSGGSAINALPYVNIQSDIANDIDPTEFLPFIEDSTMQLGAQSFQVQSTGGAGNYTVSFVYSDTWI